MHQVTREKILFVHKGTPLKFGDIDFIDCSDYFFKENGVGAGFMNKG